MEQNHTRTRILRAISHVLAILALTTLLPYKGAHDISIMGYKSLCPFAPISTAIALYLSYTIHRYLENMTTKRRTK